MRRQLIKFACFQLTSIISVPTIYLRCMMGTIVSPFMMVAMPKFRPTIFSMSFQSLKPRIIEFLSSQMLPRSNSSSESRSADMSQMTKSYFKLGEIPLNVISQILYKMTLLNCLTLLCIFISFLCSSYSRSYLFILMDPGVLHKRMPNLSFYFYRKQSQVLLCQFFLLSHIVFDCELEPYSDLSCLFRNVVFKLKLNNLEEQAVQFCGVLQFFISDMFFKCTRQCFLLSQSSILINVFFGILITLQQIQKSVNKLMLSLFYYYRPFFVASRGNNISKSPIDKNIIKVAVINSQKNPSNLLGTPYFHTFSSPITFMQYYLVQLSLFYNRLSMEIKVEKSEKSSEISYLRLQNSREVQTPEQGNFLLKQQFLTHLLQMGIDKKLTNFKACQDEPFNYESDEGFLQQLYQIVQKHESQPEKMEEKKPLDDATCQQIHEICQRHGQASRFNIYCDYEASKIPPEMKCKCGCGRAQGDPLPICTDQLQHYFFGPTILIFFFMRKMVIILILIALVYGLYAVITNMMMAPEMGNNCNKPGTLSFLCPIKVEVTTLNKINNDTMMEIQVWLGFLLCLIWIIAIRVLRSLGRILNKKIDNLLDSSSDYVIQISNLPYGGYSEIELLKYLCSLWRKMKGKNCKLPGIKSVQIIYQMDESRKMIKSTIENARKLASNLTKRQKDGKTIYQIKEGHLEVYLSCKMQLIRSMVKIQDYRQNFINNAEFRKSLATDIAFIEFNDSNDQADLLKQTGQYRITMLGELKQYIMSKIFNNEQDHYIFKGNNIRITRAPEPSDINWPNCQKKNSYKRIALVWFIALLMLGISFGFLTLIRMLRSTFTVLESISIIVSISLQTFNRIIWNTLISAVSLEQNNTKTQNVISIMSKGAFAQAINVLVLPLIFNYVMKKNLYGPEGLINSSLDYHFTFFFMQIFLNLINVPYQFTKLTLAIPYIRNWIIRKKSQVVGVVDTSEEIKEVLAYYEAPSFSIASAYTSVNTIIFHTMFYIHMNPILIFSLIFNIIFLYFMHKFLLLRRYKIPELVDFIIFQNFCSFLQHVPLIYAIGSLTFMYLTENSATGHFDMRYIPSILCIGMWLLCVLNPFSFLNKLTKILIGIFGYNENQNIVKESGCSSENMGEDLSEDNQNKVFKRRECYYNGCGTNQLLEYQAKLTQIVRTDEYQNLNKIFCEKFNLKPGDQKNMQMSLASQKPSGKKSSMKMLPKIKQSFAKVKEPENKTSMKKSTPNNRILPIDACTFNDNIKPKQPFVIEEEKQNKAPRKLRKEGQKQPKTPRDIERIDDTKNRLVINRKSKQTFE